MTQVNTTGSDPIQAEDPANVFQNDDRANETAPPHNSEPSTPLLPDDGSIGLSSDGSQIPLESASEDTRRPRPKGLSFLDGLAIVVSLEIGSGIFASPAQISRNVPNPGLGVLVWLAAGFLVWTGAASFIELGMAMPQNGGIQEYLRACYGDYMGCLFSWTWVWISKSASLAIIASVFADYLCRAFSPDAPPSRIVAKAVGLAGLWLITLINWTGPKAGVKVANGLLVLKIAMLLGIFTAGTALSITGQADGVPKSDLGWFGTDSSLPSTSVLNQIAGVVTATFGALFGYNGWESIGFLLGDMKHPAQDLPRILYSALAIVITGFTLVNIALYSVVPFEQVRQSNTPFVVLASESIGSIGLAIFSVSVALSALGTLNGNLFSNGALSIAASRQGYFPALFSNMHCSGPSQEQILIDRSLRPFPRFVKAPVMGFARLTAYHRYSMLAHASVGTLYLIIGTLDGLLTFGGISQYFFLFFTVFGIFILRRRAQREVRSMPYRTATWNPIVFCICSAFILVRGVLSNIWQGIALVLLLMVSWILFSLHFAKRVRSMNE